MVVSANRLELLQIADAVAREKSIDKSIVIAAMADAIQKAARSRYGQETNIRADINPNTGEMKLQRLMEVVETVEDYGRQIALSSARERNPDAEVGEIERPLHIQQLTVASFAHLFQRPSKLVPHLGRFAARQCQQKDVVSLASLSGDGPGGPKRFVVWMRKDVEDAHRTTPS